MSSPLGSSEDVDGSLSVLNIVLTYVEAFYEQSTYPHMHYCSLGKPCRIALQTLLPFFNLRLVSSRWNSAIQKILLSKRHTFFSRVEDAYYPHPWHISTRVRKTVLLNRYRIFHTIDSEHGDRGVYLAHDFGGTGGCAQAEEVVVKSWVSGSDRECVTENLAYKVFFDPFAIKGVPKALASAYDTECEVYAIVLQKLGPSLEDLRAVFPGGRFDEKMVLAVAIQMLDRCKDIHARGIIHNGIKPGNICLAPKSSASPMLYAIDFGLSFPLDLLDKRPLPRRGDSVGNRRFMSIYGHHGITQSQRDDLESLAYLLSYLHHGSLPWDQSHHQYTPSSSSPSYPSDSHSPSQSQPQPHLWCVKMSTPASDLFAGMDRAYIEFWKDVRGLAFGEVPDYDRMKEGFGEYWGRRGFGIGGKGEEGELDWWGVWDSARKGDNPLHLDNRPLNSSTSFNLSDLQPPVTISPKEDLGKFRNGHDLVPATGIDATLSTGLTHPYGAAISVVVDAKPPPSQRPFLELLT